MILLIGINFKTSRIRQIFKQRWLINNKVLNYMFLNYQGKIIHQKNSILKNWTNLSIFIPYFFLQKQFQFINQQEINFNQIIDQYNKLKLQMNKFVEIIEKFKSDLKFSQEQISDQFQQIQMQKDQIFEYKEDNQNLQLQNRIYKQQLQNLTQQQEKVLQNYEIQLEQKDLIINELQNSLDKLNHPKNEENPKYLKEIQKKYELLQNHYNDTLSQYQDTVKQNNDLLIQYNSLQDQLMEVEQVKQSLNDQNQNLNEIIIQLQYDLEERDQQYYNQNYQVEHQSKILQQNQFITPKKKIMINFCRSLKFDKQLKFYQHQIKRILNELKIQNMIFTPQDQIQALIEQKNEIIILTVLKSLDYYIQETNSQKQQDIFELLPKTISNSPNIIKYLLRVIRKLDQFL